MNKIFIVFISCFLVFSCNEPENNQLNNVDNEVIKTIKLKSKQDTIDYSLGVVIGSQLKNFGIEHYNEEILLKAINDVLNQNDQNLPIHPDVAKNIVSLYIKETKMQKIAYNLDANGSFLEQNADNNKIKVLGNGIQYKEILTGNGKIPTKNDNVTIHYSGSLIDGNVFISTYDKKPVSFDIDAALKGWQEVLPLMPVGSEWEIYLPPEYAFGQNGSKNVPPNSVVIYNIKLLSIN